MKSIYNGLIILFVLISCKNETSSVFMSDIPTLIEFQKSYDLTGELVPIDYFGAENIYILDTLMIVATPKRDTLYHFISTNSHRWTGSFIKKGEGPNEFNNILKPLTGENTANGFLISFYHPARQGIFHFNLTQTLLRGNEVFQDTVPLRGLTEIYRAYQINEEEVFVDYMDFKNINQHYSIFNWKNQQLLRYDKALISGLTDHGDTYLMATYSTFSK